MSSTQISLSWNRVSNATGYLVDEWNGSAWQQIGSLNGNTTSYTVSGLHVSTTYYFDVAATNSTGTTWAANYQSITTIDHPAASSAYTAVSGSLFGTNGPSYLDVRQGAVGDCWLEASLAEVAAREPSVIRSMFTYQGTELENGSTVGLYSVRLYDAGGTAHSILVDTELPSGGGTYDHPVNGVLWVALAEKAYAEANGMRYVTTGNVGSDSYGALAGGSPDWALHAITGKSVSDSSINPSNIASAWNAGELIVLCTNSPASSYIVGNHCYAVVGYNASSNMPFEVFNPWGTDSNGWAPGCTNKTYGLFNANGAFLSQNFVTQAIGAGAENLLGSLNGSALLASGFASAGLTTGAAVTGHGFAVDTAQIQTEASPFLPTQTQQVDHEISDMLWMQAGKQETGSDFLRPSLLSFAL
jgi:hypothetical protein